MWSTVEPIGPGDTTKGKINSILLDPKKRGYTASCGTQKEDRRKLVRNRGAKENYDLHFKGILMGELFTLWELSRH